MKPRHGAMHNPFSMWHLAPGRVAYHYGEDESLEADLEIFRDAQWRGELCGPHGAGKTTRLVGIRAALEAHGIYTAWFQCSDQARHLPPVWPWAVIRAKVLFLDGGERLSRAELVLLKFACRLLGRGLLMTTHEAQHWGVRINLQPTDGQFVSLLETLGTGDLVPDARDVLRRHGGNARNALNELYDRWEQQSAG